MENLLAPITNMLGPWATSKLGHALIGLLILIVGLFIVSIIARFFRRLLTRVDFLERINLAGPIATLIKAVLTLFVLLAVLQHFGLTGVMEPLKAMLNKFVAVIPNIIGAGVIGYAGWIIAKIVSSLAGVGLRRVDQHIMSRTGHEDIKLAKFGSTFIFAALLLPIVVAALGVLNIPAITVPASAMINKLMAAIPNIIGAAVILIVSYFAAKFVTYILSGLLSGLGVDSLPQRLGIYGGFTPQFTVTKLINYAIMFFAMLTATTAAVSTLGIDIVSNIFARILDFGGSILVGALILVIGYVLSTLAYNKLSATTGVATANIARFGILGLVLAMGLRAMGLADNIVNMAFGFTLGTVAVAAAIAFGLGGREAARAIANYWAQRVLRNR
ncbi:mechanosensitive ion channel [Thiofilum flexile]|uniref:mechanosensitive ion channel n=1 Tax=Thiofilum flexile TaxID=125627 RepID=UPI00037C0EB5|nr:mechanosensitive ion channel [Thiofilum flexile]